ncbi:hypothetical protein GALMADRAFT_272090 [Galerina marginata CBS 339.88]|uniref:Uncharacterized protein n=1 Tax=Galerina marginata (strain CBS 339.88) TaxID=685588 RepID=A0A067SE51_GALM3|nr:hypothetical protein GALMADRAFT_272090 [Galerina marginata CBS 339.88]
MKHYNGLVQKNNAMLILPVSDGQSFVFSFPASACKNAQSVTVTLSFDNICLYKVDFKPKENGLSQAQYDNYGTITLCYYGWLNDDSANFVFRIDKTPHAFKTYINDRCISSHTSMNKQTNHESRVDMAGVAINVTEMVPITLTVFDYAEYEDVEAFSKEMRNPDSIAPQADMDGLEENGKESASDSANADIPPQDTVWMKYSSTVLWPIAIELEATNLKMGLQQKHDTLMAQWVVAHDDDIALNTIDYFVHSHQVIWPRVLTSVNPDKAAKIRERHAQLFKNLPRAKAERSQGTVNVE